MEIGRIGVADLAHSIETCAILVEGGGAIAARAIDVAKLFAGR